jgi:hypothetical protein
VRTFDDNKAAINQLWPTVKFTDEERKLWRDDLASLDQDVLYDAIRNAKRTHDGPWPQLKWVLDCYRELHLSRKRASTTQIARGEKLNIKVDAEENQRLASDFLALIDISQPCDFADVEKRLLDKLPTMKADTAVRVLRYARNRLLGETQKFGRVTDDGDIAPIDLKGVA